MKDRRLFIITGLSGAGKSQTLKIFEDFGFFCGDNMPMSLIGHFVDLIVGSDQHKEVALGLDIRGRSFIKEFSNVLKDVRSRGIHCRVLSAANRSAQRRFVSDQPLESIERASGDVWRKQTSNLAHFPLD